MMEFDKPREECAVFGVSLRADEAAGIVYNGLLSLQHRGQEGAGIAVALENGIRAHKAVGLVSEVFGGETLGRLSGARVGIGHARYSTTGANTPENVGPFQTEYLTGRIATAHNGNITNARELRERLEGEGLRFTATSDSEVISSLIAFHTMRMGDLQKGVVVAASQLRGSFSLIILSGEGEVIAVRDPSGYRPLCLGEGEVGVAVASESCALDGCGFSFTGDVKPGEVVRIRDGRVVSRDVALTPRETPGGLCLFEFVYFARPDSVIDGASVYEARYNMGRELARECPVEADVVCGVPDSGIEAAIGYSAESRVPLVSGFVKNRYIGRSFIYPTQAQRESAVRLKLNPLAANVSGKRVVLVDDSIVRGTTSAQIVRSLRHAGAREVHVRISSPPFRHTCAYGTDIDDAAALIANRMALSDICAQIGADSLYYISIEGLLRACGDCRLAVCQTCFTGSGEAQARKDQLERA